MNKNNKLTVYVDVDDTILYSSEAVTKILNNKYGLNLTVDEYKKGVCEDSIVNYDQAIVDAHVSDEFFASVEIQPGFMKFYKMFADSCNIVFLTFTKASAIDKKTTFLKEHFPKASVGCYPYTGNFDKGKYVTTKHSIIIDDRFECVRKVASKIKILKVTQPTPPYDAINSRVYFTRTWDEIIDMVKFINDNKDQEWLI